MIKRVAIFTCIAVLLVAFPARGLAAERQTDPSSQTLPSSGQNFSSKDIVLCVFGAGGWLGFIAKILWDKREAEHPFFAKYDEMLAEPELAPIVHIVRTETNDGECEREGEELRNLPAFLESIAHHCNNHILSFSAVDKKYGELFLQCSAHKPTWADESAETRKVYWHTFDQFVLRLKKDHRSVGA